MVNRGWELTACAIRIGGEQAEYVPVKVNARERPDSSDYWDANRLFCAVEEFRSEHDQATVALLRALGKDEPGVREACDSALRHLKDRRDAGEERRSAAILRPLIEALTSHERLVRYHAAGILGEIGAAAHASVPALVAMLRDASDPTRPDPVCQAAQALGEIAPATPQAAEAAAALISFFRGTTLDVRRAQAAGALARFGPELTAPILPILLDVLKETMGKDGPPAPAVCAAIGGAAPGAPSADKAVEALSAALDSRWVFTRSEAATALARFGPQARSALPRLRALEKTDREPAVRNAASSALSRIERASDQRTPE